MADHICSEAGDDFEWDDGTNRDINLDFYDEDIKDLSRMAANLEEALPDIFDKVAKNAAKIVLPDLRRNWPEEQALQFQEMAQFQGRLEKRWGTALGKLRMLLTMAREIAGIAQEEARPDSGRRLHELMVRLHVRSCQVALEVITLLERGLADGAMARWRTLHEITIVMELLDQHGEPLAERYWDHQVVEAKAAMDQYKVCAPQLGYEELDEERCHAIQTDYDEVLQKHGKFFRTPYGWADGFVPRNHRGSIGLGELEAAAGQSQLASHYKLASSNVHAGPHALFFRLGLLAGSTPLLAGVSNAGLCEPGQNTAVSLTLASAALLKQCHSFDVMVGVKMMTKLMREIPTAFAKASAKLEEDHERYSQLKNLEE